MLISDTYRDLNKDLHAGGKYGLHGDKWVQPVERLISRFNPKTILDYGCGQGALGRSLSFPVSEYDPAIEGKDSLPGAADLVICTDVLEHIEPELIDDVLSHVRSITNMALFAVIATRPAQKILSDGRNAHLIVENWKWWKSKIYFYFNVVDEKVSSTEVEVVLRPLGFFLSTIEEFSEKSEYSALVT